MSPPPPMAVGKASLDPLRSVQFSSVPLRSVQFSSDRRRNQLSGYHTIVCLVTPSTVASTCTTELTTDCINISLCFRQYNYFNTRSSG